MLLIFPIIVFFFLFVGAAIFVVCLLEVNARKRALSIALWCAAWGPCIVALIMFAGLAAIADAAADEHWHLQHLQHLPSLLGPAYAIIGLLGSAAVASAAAYLHQKLIHRMTFPLFRIYSCLVTAGIGSTLGCAFVLWLAGYYPGHFIFLTPAMLLLASSFGYGGFRFARHLRGEAPETLTWITKAEFDGQTTKPLP